MPLCYVFTNKSKSEIKEGTEVKLAQVIGETLGKPFERMVILIIPDIRLFRLTTSEPACVLNITSVDVFDAERNPTYTPTIKTALATELGLPEERCVIVYKDIDINFFG